MQILTERLAAICWKLAITEITLRNNGHDVLDTRITTLNDTTWYDGSDDAHIRNRDKDAQSTLDNDGNPTGEAMEGEFIAATNQFQTSSDYMNSNSIILSRADWAGTQPKGRRPHKVPECRIH